MIQGSHEFRIDPYPVNPEPPESFIKAGNRIPPIIPPPPYHNGNFGNKGGEIPDNFGHESTSNDNNEMNGDKRIKREWDPDRGGWIIPW
uniref:Uncharacterized protein n=1 Tax=Panagrolaimus superbus TaxID=310955 RepID=A0A914YG78_9BILA